jgi:hypothetical protein
MPMESASRAACSPATVAANGVLFLEPLNPALPADPHDTVLPRASVIVIVVLLKVALTCATPSASTIFFAFFPVAIGYLVTFFLPATARPLLRAGVGVRTLTTDGESATVACAPIGPDVHEALDVHRDFGAQGTLDTIVPLDDLAEFVDVGFNEVLHAQLGVHTRLGENLACRLATDAEDIRQPDLHLLFARKIHACNTRH